jgi:hypothetical protein
VMLISVDPSICIRICCVRSTGSYTKVGFSSLLFSLCDKNSELHDVGGPWPINN